MTGMRVLVTGAAGFIGYHTSLKLLNRGDRVIGMDNFNAYYPPSLKRDRARLLAEHPGFSMVEGDIADSASVQAIFEHQEVISSEDRNATRCADDLGAGGFGFRHCGFNVRHVDSDHHRVRVGDCRMERLLRCAFELEEV